jgi:cell division protein FtsN
VIETVVSGQTWYRVYVGEFDTKEEAAAARLRLLDLPRIGYARVVVLED